MNAMASQNNGVSSVYSIVCSGADQRKHQSSASLAFVRGIHRWPVNSPPKAPVTRNRFSFDDVIMSLLNTCVTSIPVLWLVLQPDFLPYTIIAGQTMKSLMIISIVISTLVCISEGVLDKPLSMYLTNLQQGAIQNISNITDFTVSYIGTELYCL